MRALTERAYNEAPSPIAKAIGRGVIPRPTTLQHLKLKASEKYS